MENGIIKTEGIFFDHNEILRDGINDLLSSGELFNSDIGSFNQELERRNMNIEIFTIKFDKNLTKLENLLQDKKIDPRKVAPALQNLAKIVMRIGEEFFAGSGENTLSFQMNKHRNEISKKQESFLRQLREVGTFLEKNYEIEDGSLSKLGLEGIRR